MNLRGARHRDEPEINFIPLIDVLLVILIFLMVTTTYQRVAELKITLPEANADPMQQRPREINVGISAQGQYMVDKTLMPFTTVGALAEALSRAAAGAKDPVIIINADANADAPVGDTRDGGGAPGRSRAHHVRHADDAQVTVRSRARADQVSSGHDLP